MHSQPHKDKFAANSSPSMSSTQTPGTPASPQSSSTAPNTLHRLPREIRDHIYHFIFQDTSTPVTYLFEDTNGQNTIDVEIRYGNPPTSSNSNLAWIVFDCQTREEIEEQLYRGRPLFVLTHIPSTYNRTSVSNIGVPDFRLNLSKGHKVQLEVSSSFSHFFSGDKQIPDAIPIFRRLDPSGAFPLELTLNMWGKMMCIHVHAPSLPSIFSKVTVQTHLIRGVRGASMPKGMANDGYVKLYWAYGETKEHPEDHWIVFGTRLLKLRKGERYGVRCWKDPDADDVGWFECVHSSYYDARERGTAADEDARQQYRYLEYEVDDADLGSDEA